MIYQEIHHNEINFVNTFNNFTHNISTAENAPFVHRDIFLHSMRVANYTRTLSEIMRFTPQEILELTTAAYSHDVGKLYLPESLIIKSSPLDEDEMNTIQEHSLIGNTLLLSLNQPISATVALEHHEYWNGSGYPYGLKGENISLYSRITTICDVFDALNSKRSYKPAWQMNDILHHFEKMKGILYDPQITTVFLDHIEEFSVFLEPTTLFATA